jgi:hypothetical protein
VAVFSDGGFYLMSNVIQLEILTRKKENAIDGGHFLQEMTVDALYFC